MASLKTLYSSLIFPHYSYCLEAWGTCLPKYSKRITAIQKKAVRTVFRSHYLSHSEPRMKALNILKFNDQYQYQCLVLLFNMLKGYAPDIYNLIQSQSNNVRISSLRSVTNQPQNLRLPCYQTGQSSRTFLSLIPDLWNELSTEMQCAPTQSFFKKHLKLAFVSNYEERTVYTNPTCVDTRHV